MSITKEQVTQALQAVSDGVTNLSGELGNKAENAFRLMQVLDEKLAEIYKENRALHVALLSTALFEISKQNPDQALITKDLMTTEQIEAAADKLIKLIKPEHEIVAANKAELIESIKAKRPNPTNEAPEKPTGTTNSFKPT